MDPLREIESLHEPAHEPAPVEELLRGISSALRSYRLYGGESGTLDRFVAAVRQRALEVWETEDALRLTVDEHRFCWRDRVVYPSGGESGDLPFLFYKDGIRELTLLPGFEDEALAFLGVVARASQVRSEEDDLVTLMWEADLASVRHKVVEIEADGVAPAAGGEPPSQVDPAGVRASAASPPQPENRGFTPDDFAETLYFLDQADLRRLADEVRREAERDLWGGILTALFDRLEDGDADRQLRIVTILGDILPSMLGAGRLDRAGSMLREMVELAARPDFLPAPALRAVRSLINQLASRETIDQLVLTLEDSPDALQGDHLAVLLGFFPPESLVPLMRAAEAVTRPDVRRAMDAAVERLATSHRDSVVALLEDSDPALVISGATWVGRLQVGSALQKLLPLLDVADPAVRLAAVGAIQELRAATAAPAVIPLLEDEAREVRIAAAKALAALECVAARKQLESIVTSKRLRATDRSEKIAFFEAYGRIAGAEGVALLDRTLNGKSWRGKIEPTEIRACAALALARVRHDSAKSALLAASEDEDAVVRSAVGRALRGEST